ncbi:molecular chaperone HtpG [Sphaerochaeta halotolerans]|jgi:molecular chaperone HtpG|uniref:molecular chaperone HtpG n=1 Tax=Sphaerochaeta halotolerans TaxID=2293840 RepID=UPI00136B92A0|nr:molecular chaperone HtpG [Sphaerochaeta halotolerans]MBG0768071.1 molecular chaperone HtpG [Spirochaetaceae bacterium]MDK2859407.1 molecular chaperone HtpG [Sphaerochaeta sp.]MDN5334065.1 molecular chaperone HtpG [Sphaerochaeta sp.]MXI87379.1 molecular chaperone HtpG [Sphaerochaeta halotolerans]
MEQKKFKTEVSELLHLIIHSLYSHKEIFLRELVSNSSDALDKLKYLTLTDDKLKNLTFEPRIDISFSEEGEDRTLTISDNGLGMSHDDLADNLGTIASSGTKKFLSSLTEEQKKDSNLIGQFGVGFYSAFMVAKKVEVVSRKAGEEQAWKWSSTGKGSYTLEEAKRESQGTTITLYLNEEGSEYANRWQIEQLVKKYSDHIAYPIFLSYDQTSYDDKKKDDEGNPLKKVEHKIEQINSSSALWRRSKSELTDEEYKEFYKQSSYDSEDPLFYLHTRAEGATEYITLFFIPSKAPFDMYYADYKPGVKLYVKRVYITDDDKELLPSYLRFVRGIIDSEDLPLNVSREILQQNRVMNAIRTASVKKLLGEFQKISEQNPDLYAKFIEQYNRPLKEGLYSDYANRDALLELVRFKSSSEDGYVSLASYKERMKSDQKSIYYITGGKEETLKASPLLEAYRKKGYEVLIMSDDIDDIVVGSIGTYKELPLKAINKSGAVDDLKEEGEEKKKDTKEAKALIKKVKKALGDKVKDVVASSRLADSPAVVVVDENDPSVQMQQILKSMGQTDFEEAKPILEINVEDPMVKKIENSDDEQYIEQLSSVLLDQALLAEGVMPKDPVGFAKRLHALLST